MKILIIAGIFPPDIGGPATYVPMTATFLCERGHTVSVLTLSDHLHNAGDEKYPFQLVRLSRRMFKPWRWLYAIIHTIRLGRDKDVIFVNGIAMEAVLANYLLRKPLVQKIVGDFAWERSTNWGWVKDTFDQFQQKRYNLKIEIVKRLRAWWTNQATRIIVPSKYLADCVQHWHVPSEKIKVIYNAVDVPKENVAIDIPLHTPIKLVTVVRLVPWKHVDMLIKTVARLDNVGLVVVGDGPEKNRLVSLTETLGVTDKIYFAGSRSKVEAMTLMRAGDIFVLNSTYEGLPHVVVEAIVNGLPVVATAVGGTPEVVQDGQNGRLIPPLNEQALYETILELIESPSERQRLANGTGHTLDMFKLDRMLNETATLLESI